MTFWMGLIVGAGFGALLCSVFYMFVIKWALRKDNYNKKAFEKIQAANGEYIKRIAISLENYSKVDRMADE